MKQYLIGIDVGTSGTKSVLFDIKGNVIASETREYPMSQPQNGWAEQNPEDWWDAAVCTLRKLTEQATDGEIVGIGLSGQMHSLVMLDECNEVIRPAILWCDQRTGAECVQMEEMIGRETLVRITGNPAMPAFTAAKLLWVRNHEPQNFARCKHILLAKDYIRFRLTGEYATEVSDASGMQLMHIEEHTWSEEICDKLGIDVSALAKIYESPDVTGHVTEGVAALTGLSQGIPVAGGAADNAAAAVGMGICQEGRAFTTIGTSGVILAHTDRPVTDPKGRVNTFCSAVPDAWQLLGVTQAAGLSLNWFRRTLASEWSYREIDEICKRIPIGSERLLYLPYLMGDRTPILDSNARGVFFGLSAMHTKQHMARAVIEGISFSLYSCLEVLREIDVPIGDMALCGGGGKSPFWQQLLSDLYDMPIKTTVSEEGAALGVAILAGCAAGLYESVPKGCEAIVREKNRSLPNSENTPLYRNYYRIYADLYPALKASFHKLAVQDQ